MPSGRTTRPTSDRVREAMFSSLDAMLGGFDGLRVLDLYAGSGALGLEALSRGALNVTFIESDARAVRTIRGNLADVGLPGGSVIHDAVERVVAGGLPDGGAGPFDLVLADPPYGLGSDELGAVLARLASGWLVEDSVVVVERDRRSPPVPWPERLAGLRERAYGETVLWYGRSARVK